MNNGLRCNCVGRVFVATGQLFKFQIQCVSAFSRCQLFEVLPNSVIRIDIGVGGKAFRWATFGLAMLGLFLAVVRLLDALFYYDLIYLFEK